VSFYERWPLKRAVGLKVVVGDDGGVCDLKELQERIKNTELQLHYKKVLKAWQVLCLLW